MALDGKVAAAAVVEPNTTIRTQAPAETAGGGAGAAAATKTCSESDSSSNKDISLKRALAGLSDGQNYCKTRKEYPLLFFRLLVPPPSFRSSLVAHAIHVSVGKFRIPNKSMFSASPARW